IRVTDWVQAGRYAVGLDPATPVGGPTSQVVMAASPKGFQGRPKSDGRQLQVTDALLFDWSSNTVDVALTAQGNESAVGFSLSFDPTVLRFSGATLGSGAPGATLNVNTSQTNSGRLGFALALSPGSRFSAGAKQLVKLNLRPLPAATGTYTVAFGD